PVPQTPLRKRCPDRLGEGSRCVRSITVTSHSGSVFAWHRRSRRSPRSHRSSRLCRKWSRLPRRGFPRSPSRSRHPFRSCRGRRQARRLAEALALGMGVSGGRGGDGGPASSVGEMMGLREFDAFLLVVDDVPWGGAFNPALATLDLTNLDRIEVVRGSAPVLY